MLCLLVSFDNSRECEGTLGGGPLERKVCELYSGIVSLLNLEVDCGRDRVRQCRLLTPYQDGPHQKLFSQAKI